MTPTLEADPALAAIRARVLGARASTDPVVLATLRDLDYLLRRLEAAEDAAEAGAAYARAAMPHLRPGSFIRCALAEPGDTLGAAMLEWERAR